MPAAKRDVLRVPADPFAHPALSESVRALAKRGVVRNYRKGTILIEEGDCGDTIYIILGGKLRAYSTNASGREITYGTYGPGEYLGEMSLDGGSRSASVAVIEQSTCSIVSRSTLEQFIAEHPSFAFELIAKVIRRARAATLSTKQLALNDVYGRLKLLLESFAIATNEGHRVVREPLTHRDLASRLGCSREMVTRLMKDLAINDYVKRAPDGGFILRLLPARW